MKIRCLIVCIVCLTLVAVPSFIATGFEWDGYDGTELEEATNEPEVTGKLKLIDSNDLTRLYYNEATTELAFEVDGQRFSSAVTGKYAGTDKDMEKNMRELFSFLVFNPKSRTTQSFSALENSVNLSFTKVENGFDVKAQKKELSFLLCFRLDGGNLKVSVPWSSVIEGDDCLVSITLMPFFGACNSAEDGYIFYPDGCGTLYRFNNKPSVSCSAVTKLIYGDAMNELDDYIIDRAHNTMPLTLPVFGIKRGDSALFAKIQTGCADTSLTMAPIGYMFNLARVYPTFNYRYSYFEQTVSGNSVLIFNDSPVKTDFSVSYTILSGEKSSYIGMAQTIRDELFGKSDKPEKPNISVDLLMTTQKSMLLWNTSRVVTTFEQVGDFLKTLDGLGIDNVRLNLLGWQSKGYNNYPAHLPVSGAAGGESGLRALTDIAKESGSLVQLQDNFAEGDFKGSGFSIRRDAVYNMQNKPLSDTQQTKLLLDIGRGFGTFSKSISKLAGLGINGYSFDLFGSLVYDNVASGRTLRRQDYIDQVNEYLSLSNEQFGNSAIDGANYYALENVGFIYNLPDSSSREFIYDEDVPFLQIVLHGYKPYSGRSFGNFSNSVEEAALRWLEYGYVPSFVLGHKSPSILKNSKSEGFFYSKIDDWTGTIGEIYEDFLSAYDKIKDQAITGYVKEEGICEITYENGLRLLINYNRNPVVIDGVNVNAMSYIFK